mgnify:CR=1 FL=1
MRSIFLKLIENRLNARYGVILFLILVGVLILWISV